MPLARFTLLLLAGLFTAAAPLRAGVAPFTDPGTIDFDTAMGLLNPYGTWAKVGDKWTFTPLDHAVPYTHGRWIYSEYGWYWKGTTPHSWLTEHYGYWKRGADQVWAWYPGPYWLPQTVEIRASPDGIGWRSAEVDANGNFVEQPSERFTKTGEWTFVTPAHFAGPITPDIIAKPPLSEQMLEESIDSVHSYLTYREIDRPGPHPADFVNMGDGQMFAPMTVAEREKALRPSTKAATSPATHSAPVAAATSPSAKPMTPAETARLAASLTASEAAPEIPQQPGGQDPNDDPRQVKYWVTMCLPHTWTPVPVDAARDQVYVYRPDFYQDEDGIERRITFWLNPSLRSSEAIHLQDVLNHRPALASGAPNVSGPTAAVPAAAARDFTSPFDDSYRDAGTSQHSTAAPLPAVSVGEAPATPAAPTNATPSRVPAPSGRAGQ